MDYGGTKCKEMNIAQAMHVAALLLRKDLLVQPGVGFYPSMCQLEPGTASQSQAFDSLQWALLF